MSLIVALVIGSIGYMLYIMPTSFVPQEDQGLIFGNVQLPETASINETQNLFNQMGSQILKMEGVKYFISIAGASMLGGSGENIGLIVVGLNDWNERKTPALSLQSINAKLVEQFKNIQSASIDFYALPSIPGVGSSDGLSFDILALNQNMTSEQFANMVDQFLMKMNQNKNFEYAFSTFRADTPHLYLDIDRTKLESYGVSVSSLFETLQNNLGSRYVNNITLDGQVNKVIIQADYDFRKSQQNVLDLYAYSANGTPIQVRNFATIHTVVSPSILYRYNQYMSASVIAAAASGISTGQAIAQTEQMDIQDLKQNSGGIAWTGLSLQEVETRGLATILIGLAIIFGYLFLVALYESWLVALSEIRRVHV